MNKPIQVFLRHCYYSRLQEFSDRKRPQWFDKENVFKNFKRTINNSLADYYIIYDEHFGSIKDTFLVDEQNVKIINCGCESDSFIHTLNYIVSKDYSPETIIYFLEDDYLHLPNWCEILLEGFTLGSSYVTLYDFDYFLNDNNFYKLFKTQNTHWRVVPATTNTFACKYSILLEDYEIHKDHSLNAVIDKNIINDESLKTKYKNFSFSRDYDKFWVLSQKHNKYVISPMPGYSTHCDMNHLSPFRNWDRIIKDYSY